jgi:rod shape-determining protein MreC
MKLALGSVFMPLFGLAGSGQDVAKQARQALLPKRQLAQQVEALQLENDALRLKLTQTAALWQENERLRRELAWRKEVPWQLRLARVIGHDPSNWWRSLWIDLGSREAVKTNMPVLTADGVVGRIAEVAFTRSRVVLAGDPNCRFAGQVASTRAKGIVMPDEGSFDRQIVHFTYVPTMQSLRPGEPVITSGEGGVFPKGIAVGRIVDVATNVSGLYLDARVRLAANLNRLEEVWVLFP